MRPLQPPPTLLAGAGPACGVFKRRLDELLKRRPRDDFVGGSSGLTELLWLAVKDSIPSELLDQPLEV